MSYKRLLNRQALKAFNMLKDLAEDAVFTNTSLTGFDFNTASVNKTTDDGVPVKLVVIETKKEKNTVTLTVLGRFVDLGLFDQFDTIALRNKSWSIGETLQEAGQVLIFELVREGNDG